MLKNLREIGLLFISAALLVLPFHFGELWALAFFAFLPYFFVLDDKTPAEAFKSSTLFGCIFFALLGYWLTLVNVFGFALMVLYLGLYFGFFGLFASLFLNPSNPLNRVNPRQTLQAVFFVAAFWVVSEYLRGWTLSGIPWSLLAYSQWRNTIFIQISELTGAYGVSFAVLLVNLFLFKGVQILFFEKKLTKGLSQTEFNKKRLLSSVCFGLGATLLVVVGYGAFSLNVRDRFYKDGREKAQLRVAVLQGNIPQDQKWDAKIKNIIFEKYKRLTLMSALEKSDLIVWPETSFPGYLEDEPILAAQLRSLVRQSRTDVLVGAPTLGDIEQGLRFYNSAILYGPDGEERMRYNKVHLVPFGEFIPFETVFGWLRNFVHIGRFSHGREKTIFPVESRYQSKKINAKFGVLICYEDIFPGLVRDFVRNGADFMINMTNDAWFGKTKAPYQHAQASVFRAVENRVNIVRATNTGFSCFISPEGRILASVEDKGEEIFVTGHKGHELILRRGRSFYTHFGDWFVFLTFGLAFLAYRNRLKNSPYSRI